MDNIKKVLKKMRKSINIKNWEKKIVFICIVFSVLIFFFIRTYENYVKDYSIKEPEMEEEYSSDDSSIYQLNEKNIVQTIRGTYNGLSAISIKFSLKELDGRTEWVHIYLKNGNKEVIQSWDVSTNQMNDGAWNKFTLDNEINDSADKTYYLELQGESGNRVGVYISNGDIYSKGECVASPLSSNVDLIFATYGSSYSFLSDAFYLLTFFGIFVAVAVIIYVLFALKVKLEMVFLSLCIGLGIIYMFVFPPFSAPDESAHFVASFHLAEEMMGVDEVPKEQQLEQDVYDNDGIFNRTVNLKTYRKLYNGLQSSSMEYVDYYRSQYDYVGDGKILKLGHYTQAVGIILARKMSLGYIQTVYLARLINLLVYATLVFFAIRIMPKFRVFMMLVALLPISIELAASISYDGWINSFAFLFIAYCMRLIYVKEKINIWNTVFLTLLLILCAQRKFIYYPLGILAFLIPKQKIKDKTKHKVLIVVLAVLLIFVSGNVLGIGKNNDVSEDVIEEVDNDNGKYTLREILIDPVNSINMFGNTVRLQTGTYIDNIVGTPLGSLNIGVNRTIIYMIFTVLLLALLNQKNDSITINKRQYLILSIATVIPCLLALLAMFASWTPRNYNYIFGVQGRYFLPTLPLLAVLLKDVPIKVTKNINNKLIVTFIFLHVWLLMDVFQSCIIN